jgi:iron complex outermembrane receptor protein
LRVLVFKTAPAAVTRGLRIMRNVCRTLTISICISFLAAGTLTFADADARSISYDLNIPSEDLTAALQSFAIASHHKLLYKAELTAGKISRALKGHFTTQEAMEALLSGTGLSYEITGSSVVLIKDSIADKTTDSRGEQRDPLSGDSPRDSLRVAQSGSGQSSQSSSENTQNSKNQSTGSLPSAEGKDHESKLEEIVITGSHIRGGTQPVGPEFIVIGRDEIDKSGYPRLQDLLYSLPYAFSGNVTEGLTTSSDSGAQNFNRGAAIDLRGLGVNATLVLVNGRRLPSGGTQGTFTDISTIPSSAVERVEILMDGASALYGSDAVAGVVNIILRKNFEGAETRATWGSAMGDAKEMQLSQLFGHKWSSGSVLFDYQFERRDDLPLAARTYTAANRNLTAFGGTDQRLPYGNPGTILTSSGQPAYAIPAGQNGLGLTAGQLLPGKVNYWNSVANNYWLPNQKTNSALLTVSQSLSDRVDVTADLLYSSRQMFTGYGSSAQVLSIPSSNPFYVNPFGGSGPVRVGYDFGNDLSLSQDGRVDLYTATLGSKVRLAGDWQLNINGSYGKEKNTWHYNNLAYAPALNAALANSNPATAFNAFGDGSNTSPATIKNIRETFLKDATSEVRSVGAVADGPVAAFLGGVAKGAMGVDYRDESLHGISGTLQDATGIFNSVGGTIGHIGRHVSGAFAELQLPFVGLNNATSGVTSADLSVAGRYEDYSDAGTTFNAKIGLSVGVYQSLKIKGTWGTSFRAPRFGELSLAANPNRLLSAVVADPKSPSGQSTILYTTGNNPGLSPERARTWTTGLEFAPVAIPQLDVSLTYYEVHYKNRIEVPPVSITNILQLERQWTDIITRNPTATQIASYCNNPAFTGSCAVAPSAVVDFRARNLAALDTNGVDLDGKYSQKTRYGIFTVETAGTYTFRYARAVSAGSDMVSVLDSVGNPISLRLRMTGSWQRGGLGVGATVNYAGSYRDQSRGVGVDPWTIVDTQVRYAFQSENTWLAGTHISASSINVFNKRPPFVNTSFGIDTSNSTLIGRVINVQLVKNW